MGWKDGKDVQETVKERIRNLIVDTDGHVLLVFPTILLAMEAKKEWDNNPATSRVEVGKTTLHFGAVDQITRFKGAKFAAIKAFGCRLTPEWKTLVY